MQVKKWIGWTHVEKKSPSGRTCWIDRTRGQRAVSCFDILCPTGYKMTQSEILMRLIYYLCKILLDLAMAIVVTTLMHFWSEEIKLVFRSSQAEELKL